MRSLGWLVLLAVVGMARAQQVEIVPEMPVDSAVLRQWLHSGEPRLIAWAADFARQRNDAETLAEMPGVLERWSPLALDALNGSASDQRRAILAVLDALIQGDVPVHVGTIHKLAAGFPEQAVILLGRVPVRDARWVLMEWANGSVGGQDGQMLARVASMMMAKEPDVEFVGRVVAASEELLEVVVVRPGEGSASGAAKGFACGGLGGVTARPGWPALRGYRLTENASVVTDGTVIELDGDRISFQRFEGDGLNGQCAPVESLDAATRHRLIAHWLKVGARQMTWQPLDSTAIVWTNGAAFERDLGAVVMGHRETLRETTRTLRAKWLLREEDTVEPRLVVTIRCAIKPCPVPGAGE